MQRRLSGGWVRGDCSACDEDATPQATPGYMLMGGSTDVNAGFRWFNGNTNGGDVVVIRCARHPPWIAVIVVVEADAEERARSPLRRPSPPSLVVPRPLLFLLPLPSLRLACRASGSDGYNDYIYDLGGVASVTTLVTNQARGAEADEVEERILRAEGIFMAGGDQWDYVSMWNNTRLSRAVQHCITNKTVTLGGTSAGTRRIVCAPLSLVRGARRHLGQVNLSRKTLVDKHFLI